MKKRRKILLALFGVLIFGAVLWAVVFRAESGPSYNGRTLRQWLIGPANPAETRNAVRQIGTNAIPYLLKWIQYEEPDWEINVRRSVNRFQQGRRWNNQNENLADAAVSGFQALGSQAEGVIPELTVCMNSGKGRARTRAIDALGGIGEAAYPHLISVLTNTNRSLFDRQNICSAMAYAAYKDSNAVPVLLMVVRDLEPILKEFAIDCLGEIAPEALNDAMQSKTNK